ncbi:MAG: CesT family type III secretion system chaperone [Myxococcales bacterium]
MTKTREDVERILESRERFFTSLDDGTIMIPLAPEQAPAMLRVEPPVVLLQVNIGEPTFDSDASAAAFYRRLLELNATGLLHASYGIEAGHVVLSSALELENLDANELEAALADLALALVEHIPSLRQMALAVTKG